MKKRSRNWILIAVIVMILGMTAGVFAANQDDLYDTTTKDTLLTQAASQTTDGKTTLVDFSKLTVSKQEVTKDEVQTITIDVGDNPNNIDSISIYYKKPGINSMKSLFLRYDENNRNFSAELSITDAFSSGEWIIQSIFVHGYDSDTGCYLNENYYNSNCELGYSTSNPKVDLSVGNFTVYGTTGDTKAPEIVENSLSVTPKSATIGETVTFSIAFTDDKSDVSTASINYQKPITKRSQSIWLSYNIETGCFEGKITITDAMEFGDWCISTISVSDTESNNETYSIIPETHFRKNHKTSLSSSVST